MSSFRFYVVTISCLVLFLIVIPFSANGQDIPDALKAADEAGLIDPLKIRVDVSEVRLDVVVLDNKGRQITDLTAADFEVIQDGLPQAVTSGFYIRNQADAAARPATVKKNSSKIPPPAAATTLKKEEDVSRTILFVVDNLSMYEYSNLRRAKDGINRFLANQMLPGDMVAIINTGSGSSAMDFFSSDKRRISARAEAIPLQGLSDGCYQWDDPDQKNVFAPFAPMILDNQASTLSYSIRALKDMPGRKILFHLTSCPAIPGLIQDEDIFQNVQWEYAAFYEKRFSALADEALRAGVVVHSLDTRGLVDPWNPEIETIKVSNAGALNPLPAKTGGIYVENSNFFRDATGIGKEASNMIAGYYLVSYVPPSNTFNLNRRNVYHRVKVRVKRRGAVVYTRDGFYGRMESETDSDAPPAHPLQKAMFSPFQYADINVNMTAGYVKASGDDYLVRSWIHVDPKDVKVVETEDGGARIDIETVCLTSDIGGIVHDFVDAKYTINIDPEKKSENLAWIQKHGIRFSMMLPVKKPGFYTVRVAVQDVETGNIGSAYQSVEIPDLKKKGMTLSNIFMITSADDLNWMRSEEITEGLFFPMLQEEEVRSPALRTYSPGDRLQMLAMLYNADAQAIARSEIEILSVLYKDDEEFLRGESVPINQESAGNPADITVLQKLTLNPDMQPGDYTLQLLVIDKDTVKKSERAVSKAGGLLSKIMRVYVGEDKIDDGSIKGIIQQSLNFRIKEQTGYVK